MRLIFPSVEIASSSRTEGSSLDTSAPAQIGIYRPPLKLGYIGPRELAAIPDVAERGLRCLSTGNDCADNWSDCLGNMNFPLQWMGAGPTTGTTPARSHGSNGSHGRLGTSESHRARSHLSHGSHLSRSH